MSSTAGYLASFLLFFVFILLPALIISTVVGQWAGILQGVGASLYSWTRIELFNVPASISGLFHLAAAIGFVLNLWGRVRALGRGK